MQTCESAAKTISCHPDGPLALPAVLDQGPGEPVPPLRKLCPMRTLRKLRRRVEEPRSPASAPRAERGWQVLRPAGARISRGRSSRSGKRRDGIGRTRGRWRRLRSRSSEPSGNQHGQPAKKGVPPMRA